MSALYSLSNVDPDKLSKIQEVEAEIGRPLLAFSPVEAEPARLDRDKLAKLRALEEDLGVVLVAVGEGTRPAAE
jgi:hypothetical protein